MMETKRSCTFRQFVQWRELDKNNSVQRKPLASTQSVPGVAKRCFHMNSVSASIYHRR
jgi:hypothetical protein